MSVTAASNSLRVGLCARLEAKRGKEDELLDFLRQGTAMAEREATTPVWFAVRLGPTTFLIFDSFADDSGRQAHLAGPIAQALLANASTLLAADPSIEPFDIVGFKLPA